MNEHNEKHFPSLPESIIKELPEPVIAYIRLLEEDIAQQNTQIAQLTAGVHDLEAQLAKHSSNSGKPPSSGPKKVSKNEKSKRSFRKKTRSTTWA